MTGLRRGIFAGEAIAEAANAKALPELIFCGVISVNLGTAIQDMNSYLASHNASPFETAAADAAAAYAIGIAAQKCGVFVKSR